MAENIVTVSANDVVNKFNYALNNAWGYIWGTAGVMWTQAKQDQINKTTDAEREGSRKYGKQWIGHMVADCSGLFSWAYRELGSYMYHGSNTMWDSYCTAKGELKSGKRTDGQELKPGTAVFTYNKKTAKRGHVGLYIGNGTVIEAAGAKAGVITSKVSASKWVEWGELKNTKYDGGDVPVPEGYAIVTGKRVALRKQPSTKADIIMRIDTGRQVKIETPPPSEWEYVSYQGKFGYMMKEFLKEE